MTGKATVVLDVGKTLSKGDEAAVVESVKAASEVYAPVSGEVVDVNRDLEAAPGTVNEDPAGRGWFMKIRLMDPNELDGLLTEQGFAGLKVATALNGDFVPERAREVTKLTGGDRIEVVSARQGG